MMKVARTKFAAGPKTNSKKFQTKSIYESNSYAIGHTFRYPLDSSSGSAGRTSNAAQKLICDTNCLKTPINPIPKKNGRMVYDEKKHFYQSGLANEQDI